MRGKDDIAQVGTVSSNGDASIGAMIAEAMEKVGKEGVITVEEAKTMNTELDAVEGMRFDRGYLSPYFVTDAERMEAVHEDPYLLLYEKKISSMRDLVPLLEAVARSGKALVIVAEDIEGEALATLVVNKIRGTMKVAACKAPGFGDRRKAMLEDLAVLSGGKRAQRGPRRQARERHAPGPGPRQARGARPREHDDHRRRRQEGRDRGPHRPDPRADRRHRLRLRQARSCRSGWPSSRAASR